MISVLLDKNNYFTGSYAEAGSVERGTNVNSLPPDMTKAEGYYLENGEWQFDSDKWEQLEHERLVTSIRFRRNAAFTMIDKYQLTLVYSSLTDEQRHQLAEYRNAWLEAPGTLIAPDKPRWMI